jgi:hypothetical protein
MFATNPHNVLETAHSTVDQEKDVDESGMVGYAIHLKGQMMYMPEWESIIFLGTPM